MRDVAILLVNLLLFCGCSTNRVTKQNDSGRIEVLNATIIEKADLTNTLEIDSGNFTLLMYKYFTDVRFQYHAFQGRRFF